MADTTPTTVDTSIPEVWARDILRKQSVGGFWGRFIGKEGSGMPIIQKRELLSGPGDLMHIQVTDILSGAGQSGDTATLVGNEEAISTTEIKCAPVLYRHAVRINRRANKKSIVDLRSEARFRLQEWGMVKMDNLRFTQFAATSLAAPLGSETYTPNYYTVGGTDGSPHIDDVAVGEVLTVQAVQEIKLKLMLNHAKPMMIDGHPMYALVAHPYATYKLKRDQEYRDFVKDAEVRGKDNPFFRGSLAIVDGVVIYEHERIALATNATSVQVAKNLAFGAEAFVEAIDEDVSWDEDLFEYGLLWGVALSFACQARRALEQNSLQVYASAPTVA